MSTYSNSSELFGEAIAPDELTPKLVSGRWQLTTADIDAHLQSQAGNYRTEPIYLSSGRLLGSRKAWERPVVAAESMFVDPLVDGGADKFSPRALVCDRYYDVRVKSTNSTVTLTSGSPTATISVQALDRDLPAAFGLYIDVNNRFQLEAAAAAGATSITVRRMQADCTITNGVEAFAGNRFMGQASVPSPMIEGLMLIGNPDPYINENNVYNVGRKYACDGLVTNSLGVQARKLMISNFQGHGIFLPSVGHPNDYAGPPHTLMHELGMLESINVNRCLSGITIGVNDFLANDLYASGCRDYGVRFLGGTNTAGSIIHAFGNGHGVLANGQIRYPYVESETNDTYGLTLLSGSEGSWIGYARLYNNGGEDLQLYSGNTRVEKVWATVSTAAKWGVHMGAYADSSSIDWFLVESTVASGYGIVFGGEAAARDSLYGPVIGRVVQTTGTGGTGVGIYTRLAGPYVDIRVDGNWANPIYFDNGANPVGSTIIFRGPSSKVIRWPNGTTGTIGTPSVPTAIATANTVTCLPY